MSVASDTEAYYGRNDKARGLSRRAVDSARRSDQKETAALWQMEVALREAEVGNIVEARQQAESALALASQRDPQILGALVFARTGHSTQAAKMADDLAKRFPKDTLVNGYWLPSIRASIEIKRNNSDKALEILEVSAPYELGSPNPAPSVGTPLYPIYVRGQAYLKLRKGKEAAAEFQKIIDHRGLVINLMTGVLAHLGLARAYVLQGDTAKARTKYQDFLNVWRDADNAIPILKEAKLEYAKLQ